VVTLVFCCTSSDLPDRYLPISERLVLRCLSGGYRVLHAIHRTESTTHHGRGIENRRLENRIGSNCPEDFSRFGWRVRFGGVLDFLLHYRRGSEDHRAVRKNRNLDACFRIPSYALGLLSHRECPERGQLHRFTSNNGVRDFFQHEINQNRRLCTR